MHCIINHAGWRQQIPQAVIPNPGMLIEFPAAQLLCVVQGSGSRIFLQVPQMIENPSGSVIILHCEVTEVVVVD